MAAVASATDAMAAAKISDEPAAPASKSSHLAKQDLATMDPAKLNALSPEVISRQATINIGELLPPLCSGPSRSGRRLPNPPLLPSDSLPWLPPAAPTACELCVQRASELTPTARSVQAPSATWPTASRPL